MDSDIGREIASIDRRVRQAGEQAAQSVAGSGPITGSATSPDGAVTVEVEPGGLLCGVRLTPVALSAGADALARQITQVAERATKRAGANMYDALAPVLGPGGDKHLTSLGYTPDTGQDADSADDDTPFQSPLGHNRRR